MWKIRAKNEIKNEKGLHPRCNVRNLTLRLLGRVRQNQPAVEPELQFGLIGRNVFSQQIFQTDKFSCSDLGDNLIRNWRVAGLPRSRFLDVTQRSPKRTAADIRTTFLSPNWPITARVPFLGTFSCQTHRLRLVQSHIVFYRDPHVEKYHKQHKTNGGA